MVAKNKLLVVAAHPDDEVLGCGATVAKRVSQGWEAYLLILTKGVAGRYSSQPDAATLKAVETETTQLGAEIDKATAAIGFKKVFRASFPDNRMDTVSRMDVSQEILTVLKEVRPTTIFTHHPGDYNWDHTIAFDSVMMAARSSPGEFAPQEILSFEVPSSTERSWQSEERTFRPNVYVNIKGSIDKKKLALSYYASEKRPYPHPRSIEALEYLSRKRGSEVGLEYAEAFHLIRRTEE
ncbi:PIG-L family deacetylase [bacterium]|nr:PIG-L family deacetylase [bacterium]